MSAYVGQNQKPKNLRNKKKRCDSSPVGGAKSVLPVGFRVHDYVPARSGLRFGIWVLGCGVWDLGLGFGVWVWGLGFGATACH